MSCNEPSPEHANATLNRDDTLNAEMMQDLQHPIVSPRTGDEQALESHEVIELQAFIERKAWIEEKIKVLEEMPPIEVFAGLAAVRSSPSEATGLPSRAELLQWLVDHDAIEKETEVFDSGEMRKLKKFTKAAAQRNLSPEDTDLIELTLTTIFDLDKLIHLLRDRSENLDLLEVRLTWEECRIAAWAETHRILQDTDNFLDTRARWSASVYETLNNLDEPTSFKPIIRRGSVASMSSAASVNSDSSVNSVGFSRGARFKLAEQLSKETTHIMSRISGLKHGKIAAAGKALDKLIDASRRPVPDELLDEQDQLEEKGINNLEQIGQFVTSVVGQWRKADELYVETMKDKASILNLVEEVEMARLRHPNASQSLSFTTRIDKLKRRLGLRDTPDSPRSTFPRPVHASFPAQAPFNEYLVQMLSSEVRSASELIQSANTMVHEYAVSARIVQQADMLAQEVEGCSSSLTTVIDQLETGVLVNGGDGSPPSLLYETSLNPASHSAFFALLPSLFDSLDQATQRTNQVIKDWSILSLQLEQHGMDSVFRSKLASGVCTLRELQERGRFASEHVKDLTKKLQDAKHACSCMDAISRDIDSLRLQILQEIEYHKWRKREQYSAPLTPPTPSSSLSPPPAIDFVAIIHSARSRYSAEIEATLTSLSSSFGQSMATCVDCKSQHLKTVLANASKLAGLLEAVKNQANIMHAVRDDFDSLLLRIERLAAQQASLVQDILQCDCPGEDLDVAENALKDSILSVEQAVRAFSGSLAAMVPFVSPHDPDADLLTTMHSSINASHASSPSVFDCSTLDALVRADCNSYSMRASGEMQALQKASAQIHLARLAKKVDVSLSETTDSIHSVIQQLSTMKESLQAGTIDVGSLKHLRAALEQVDCLINEDTVSISRSFSPIRDILRQMETISVAHDPSIYKKTYLSRRRAVDDADLRFVSWKEGIHTFRQTLLHAQSVETKRIEMELLEQQRLEKEQLEQQKIAEENRVRTEESKALAQAVEMERFRLEQTEEEERHKLAEARRTLQLERERFAADSAENHRLEQEHRATIERLRAEEARLREEHAKQVAEGRIAVEQAEQYRQEHERQASEKIKKIEEELQAEELRLRLEKDRITKELALLHRSQAEAQAWSTERDSDYEDVFGSTALVQTSSTEDSRLQLVISGLRKRLRALSINRTAFPSPTSAALPSSEHIAKLTGEFHSMRHEADLLPSWVDNPAVDLELKSLHTDLSAAADIMTKIEQLGSLISILRNCDAALSDLLEHVDSYPSLPLGVLSSDYRSPTDLPPEAQLDSRLTFIRALISDLDHVISSVAGDPRGLAEQRRVMQTWTELEDMAKDRLRGHKSRPPSVTSTTQGSSGRNSRISAAAIHPSTSALAKKRGSYVGLSVDPSSSRGRYLSPSVPTRRAVSGGSTDSINRSVSRLSSTSTSRSVSGPQSSLHMPTFASRQRTSSLCTSTSTMTSTTRSTQRARAQTNQPARTASPAVSDARSVRQPRSSLSSTWSRAPRPSLGKPAPQPKKLAPGPRKAYVPDPKSKLDVAVGDVVNSLPVNINIEGVAETWKDQSGKYWIGDQDPKLCFCRILRSHTVMVRVGGGWSELSKFIRDHFAESFRLMPESPPRPGAGPEKWISSATLLEAAEINEAPLAPPRTPEPKFPFVPTFALSTPTSKSPQSVKSSSSAKGSPLTPMQFIRRADPDAPLLRPTTPSKTSRAKRSMPPTPARHAIWRP